MNDLSDKLRQSRQARKLSQDKLADLIGVSQPYIAELERGLKRPSVEVLVKLCGVLGCSADFLLGVSAAKSNAAMQQEALPGGLTMAMLQEIARQQVTPEELNRALRIASALRQENNPK